MKKLIKLQINPEKLMKNEELITLKGGTNCICWHGQVDDLPPYICMTGTAGSANECGFMCTAAGCYGDFMYTGY